MPTLLLGVLQKVQKSVSRRRNASESVQKALISIQLLFSPFLIEVENFIEALGEALTEVLWPKDLYRVPTLDNPQIEFDRVLHIHITD